MLQLRPDLYFGAREPRPDSTFAFGLGWTFRNKLYYDCQEPNDFTRWGFEKCDVDYGKQVFNAQDSSSSSSFTLSTEHLFNDKGEMQLFINGSSKTGELISLFLVFDSPHGGIALENQDVSGLSGNVVHAATSSRRIQVDWTSSPEEKQQEAAAAAAWQEENVCTEHTKQLQHENGRGERAPELLHTHFTGYARAQATHAWLNGAIKSQLLASKRRAITKARQLLQFDANGKPLPTPSVSFLDRLTVPVLNNKLEAAPVKLVLQRVLRTPFSIRVTVTSAAAAKSGQSFPALSSREQEFDAKFAAKLSRIGAYSAEQIHMAKAALSNTIGSIGYFYGRNKFEDGTWSALPGAGLLTGVPSRSFFPRGFFWDEGFHQLLVSKFSPQLAQRVVESWLDRFEPNGWVAREQILGQDAIDKVPAQFLAQNRSFANPPTLLLAIGSLAELQTSAAAAAHEEQRAFLEKAFAKFMQHKRWMEQSQRSRMGIPGLMAWRGRRGMHTLTSGIDDYPRGEGKEAHVDLLAWSAWEDVQLAKLAERLGKPTSVIRELEADAASKTALLHKHHWNAKLGFFNDLGDAGFAPHVGYVGLLPFCLGLLDRAGGEKEFDSMVHHIETSLRAPSFGLRSLARFDPLFGQGENYWRGSVWININYLCIEALRHYAAHRAALDSRQVKRLLDLADAIAGDVIGNVNKQYWETGFLFESYDSITGKGRGTRPFTGWTALVVLLMNGKAA